MVKDVTEEEGLRARDMEEERNSSADRPDGEQYFSLFVLIAARCVL